MSRTEPRLVSPLFFRLLIPFGSAFFLGMFMGSINSILAPIIVADFDLSPADLGFVSSVNLIAFGLAQLPLGVFLDRCGAKKTLGGMLMIAVAGVLLFAAAGNYFSLLAARALMGVGFSGSLMASFKSFTYWLPRKRLALVFSIQSLVGGLGFMVATRPVSIVLEHIPWRTFIMLCAAAVLASALLVMAVVPDDSPQPDKRENNFFRVFTSMMELIRDRRFIYVAPVVTATEAVLFSFSYLWVGPWLRDVAMLDERSVGLMTLLSSTGIAAGYLLNGVLADFFARMNWLTWEKLYLYSGFLFTVFFAVLTFFGGPATAPLWAVVMFLSTMTMISFPIIGRLFDAGETGRVFSLLNFIIFLASFIAQWLVGIILNFYPIVDGHFAPAGYRLGLSMILVMNIAAVIHLHASIPKIDRLKKF
ncbi:MFS transporter [Cloacibacillus evryensis]|uniref:MFS transporter n=1 Tax=Cloacibacillus evryensis TaxID=508460 RepID=UPI0026717D08|nr:MFS transporter [Cloacibacillus evryensis]